ncbi:polysaccharide deacetylase [Spirochaetia bacterium]|nr:polysaccharide deacetylase [Spirochaetia bacterium]
MNTKLVFGIALSIVLITPTGVWSRGMRVNDYLEKRSASGKAIAISFDDGPAGDTEKLLAILEENGVHATFFLIGNNIRQFRDKAQLIVSKGHEIGNHSDGYDSLGNQPQSVIRASLEPVSVLIQEITGSPAKYFRAPNLDYGANLSAVLQSLGMPLIGTNVIGMDWNPLTPEEIVNNVVSAAHDGGIILLHENPYEPAKYEATRQAIPEIIRQLKAQGYDIMSVGELAQRKAVTFQPGYRYDNILPGAGIAPSVPSPENPPAGKPVSLAINFEQDLEGFAGRAGTETLTRVRIPVATG